MRRNKLVINVSHFDLTNYSSWTLLFKDCETDRILFENLEGKVQENSQLLEYINKDIAYLKRTKSTFLDYDFIFVYPDVKSSYKLDIEQINTDGINVRFYAVYFDTTEVDDNCEKFKVVVGNTKDRNAVWSYSKYGFVLLDVVSSLINDEKIKDVDSDNCRIQVTKSLEKQTTTITVSEIKLHSVIAQYKFFLEEVREDLSIQEHDEQVEIFEISRIENLGFTTINPKSKEIFSGFKYTPEKTRGVIDEIISKTKQLTEHLQKTRIFLLKRESPFTLHSTRLDERSKQELTFKDDKRANTEEIKEKIEEYSNMLNNEETSGLALPKITETDIKNLNIFSNNIQGNIKNLQARKISAKVVQRLAILFLFLFVTIAFPLFLSFSLVYLTYSFVVCLAIYCLALGIANFLYSSKLRRQINEKEREFNARCEEISNKTKVNFEATKRSLNKRKGLVENINILRKFLIKRQEERDRAGAVLHQLDKLLKMTDIKEESAEKNETESANFSITPFYKKLIKDE